MKSKQQEPAKGNIKESPNYFIFILVFLNIYDCYVEVLNENTEADLLKTSVAPPQKLDSSAILFSSPKKKDFKHRRRKIDVERQEERRKLKKLQRKFQSEKEVEQVRPYGKLFYS